ncbi:MAG: CDP-alcohol phosphatidyltransferase family protein [Hyphomicrobiales bacterium]|nr:CDP-alcohol phosphatidyltransferase family protein [Hyphomicrobiales bacterium]
MARPWLCSARRLYVGAYGIASRRLGATQGPTERLHLPARRRVQAPCRRVQACKGLTAAILFRSRSDRTSVATRVWAGRTVAGAGATRLSIPNLVTLGRILLVPVVVWAITAGEMRVAFLLFLAAGITDAIDGFLAKRFGMSTELGAYLDPLADKAMLVSIYVALGITQAIPRWLVILVVSRDIMIVSAVILSWVVDRPVPLKPHPVSKANTVAQILLVCVVLAALGFNFDAWLATVLLAALVTALTLLSVAFYVAEWVRHMNGTAVRR